MYQRTKILTIAYAFLLLQTASQKAKIKSTYCQTELYTACENFEAVDFGDISLKRDDVVGVIKQQDPMGNKTRWFVDSGGIIFLYLLNVS